MSVFLGKFKDDDIAREEAENNKIGFQKYSCFGGYENYYKGDDSDGYVYFGFQSDVKVIKLIEELNNNFQNIKVITIYFENGKLLFRIALNDLYCTESKFILEFTMAQIVRTFCPEYSHYCKARNIVDNFIDNSIKAQDSSDYGSWLCCDPNNNYICSRETFNKLDDIELINSLTNGRIDFESMPNIHKLIRVLDGSKSVDYLKEKGSVWS